MSAFVDLAVPAMLRYNVCMSKERRHRLDRLFARYHPGPTRMPAPGEWSPPWQPSGRWWMRADLPRSWRLRDIPALRAWRHRARPSRVA
jgi:hypothetical protein